MVITDDIYAMLLTHQKFSEFTDRKIADTGTAEVLIAVSVDSKADVDRIADAALKAGGRVARRRSRHKITASCSYARSSISTATIGDPVHGSNDVPPTS
jgi:predicted lactoylglutathione lyase